MYAETEKNMEQEEKINEMKNKITQMQNQFNSEIEGLRGQIKVLKSENVALRKGENSQGMKSFNESSILTSKSKQKLDIVEEMGSKLFQLERKSQFLEFENKSL